MTRGARIKFVAPVVEPEVFRKQIYGIEESTCDIVETFQPPLQCSGRPHSDSAPDDLSEVYSQICIPVVHIFS